MKHGITYTGRNAQKVVDWAKEYGFKLDGELPAIGENFTLKLDVGDRFARYEVGEGRTLTVEEFEKYLTPEQPGPAAPAIVIITGQQHPYGERIGYGPREGVEIPISRRRMEAWRAYEDALAQDTEDYLADPEGVNVKLRGDAVRRWNLVPDLSSGAPS